MSLLDKFEEVEEKKVNDVSVPGDQEPGTEEKDLKSYIDTAIDEKIANANIGEILKISKSKVLEMELIMKALEKQKEVVDEDREKSLVLFENIVTELKKFNITLQENIDIFRKELKNQNLLFIETLNKNKVFIILENIFNSKSESLVYHLKNNLEYENGKMKENIEELNYSINNFNSIYMKLWIVIIFLFLVVFGMEYHYNSKINDINEKFEVMQKTTSKALKVYSKDAQFWYSKKDHKLYIEYLENFKKTNRK